MVVLIVTVVPFATHVLTVIGELKTPSSSPSCEELLNTYAVVVGLYGGANASPSRTTSRPSKFSTSSNHAITVNFSQARLEYFFRGIA